ncbi:MAG: hypothetical protein Q8P38_07105 [Candidatus Nanopelagicales bacterium]|nr:hypothetical protein [Candidatus Nanopelagicales bacterium]
MITRDAVQDRLKETRLAFRAIPDGRSVDLLSDHDPVIVTIDDNAEGGQRMLLTTEVWLSRHECGSSGRPLVREA